MTAAQRGRANRNRGARAEVQVVNYLRSQGWPDTRRYLAGDGRQPGDIDWTPGVVLEVKDCARSAWPTWRAQCVAEAGGRIPVVLRRTRGTPDVAQWECQMSTWDHVALGGCVLVDADIWCDRTTRHWRRLPFGELVELVKEQ